MIAIDLSQTGPVRNAWFNYVELHGVTVSSSDPNYAQADRDFWINVEKDFGITDVPESPRIRFENEEGMTLFILKYGAFYPLTTS